MYLQAFLGMFLAIATALGVGWKRLKSLLTRKNAPGESEDAED